MLRTVALSDDGVEDVEYLDIPVEVQRAKLRVVLDQKQGLPTPDKVLRIAGLDVDRRAVRKDA